MLKKYTFKIILLIALLVLIMLGGCSNSEQKKNIEEAVSKDIQQTDYSEYPGISTLTVNDADRGWLVRCNGMLYAKSYKQLDCAESDEEPIGKVSDFVGEDKIPLEDFETNCEEMVGDTVLEADSTFLVIQDEQECTLYDRVYE